MSDLQEAVIKSPLLFINLIIVILSECEESHNLEFPSAQDYDVASCSKLCTTENNSPRNDITLPLLEITDFGPPARGGHFVLFHSFFPPQPYGTQFHTAHTSPVQLVSLPLPHVGGRE